MMPKVTCYFIAVNLAPELLHMWKDIEERVDSIVSKVDGIDYEIGAERIDTREQ